MVTPKKGRAKALADAKLLMEQSNNEADMEAEKEEEIVDAPALAPTRQKRKEALPPPCRFRRASAPPPPRRSCRVSRAVDILDPTQEDKSPPRVLAWKTPQSGTQVISKHKLDMYEKRMTTIQQYLACLYHSLLGNVAHQSRMERIDSTIIVKPNPPHPTTTTKDLKRLIHNCRDGRAQIVSPELLFGLGIDGKGKLNKQENATKLIHGIQSVFNYHFTPVIDDDVKANKGKNEKNAHLLGEMLSKGIIFGASAGLAACSSIARMFSRSVFLPWRILKSIDSKCQGSLNKSAVQSYVNIKKSDKIAPFKRGQSLLPGKNKISE